MSNVSVNGNTVDITTSSDGSKITINARNTANNNMTINTNRNGSTPEKMINRDFSFGGLESENNTNRGSLNNPSSADRPI